MSRKLQIGLYGLFAAFALVASFLLTFPWEALGRRLESETVKALPGSAIAINEIGPALPLGVAVGDVMLQLPGKGDQPGPKIAIPRARVTPGLLSLLTGKPAVSVGAELFGGELDGRVQLRGAKSVKAELVAEHLQLDDGGTLAGLTGFDFKGGISGRVELETDENGLVQDGQIDLAVAGAQLAKAKVMGFDLPATSLGTPEVKIAIEKGKATIEKLGLRSEDFELDVTGTVALKAQLMQSVVEGKLRAKPTDAWLERSKLKPLVSMAGSFRKPDGSFELPMNGPLSRPVNLPFMR